MHLQSEDIINQIRQQAKGKKKIVFVSGNFNIVHPGHLRLLRFASECGDFLVLGVNGNNPGKDVLLDEEIRLEGVKSVTWVDFPFILQDPPEAFISALKPAIVVKNMKMPTMLNPKLSNPMAGNSYSVPGISVFPWWICCAMNQNAWIPGPFKNRKNS